MLCDKTRREHALIKAFGATAIVLLIMVNSVGVAGASQIALVYRGPASCPDCSEAVARLLESDPNQNFTVIYVGPNEDMSVRAGLELPDAILYAQPGGNGGVSKAFSKLKADAPFIRKFVSQGGKYLGTCMGAYLVDNDPGFDLGLNTFQYIKTPKATVKTTASTYIQVMWGGTPRWIYFQDGPYFAPVNGIDGQVILAKYMNGYVAAMVQPYGNYGGKIGVCGPHPEAPTTWHAKSGVDHDQMVDYDLGHNLIDTLMQ